MTTFLDEKYDWKTLTLWSFLQEGNYPREWKEFFLRQDVQHDLFTISEAIDNEVKKGTTVYPPIHQVFRAFYSVPVKKIRLVLLGQDPYGNNSGIGLCFSVKPGNDINPSLRNIYTELKNNGYTPTEDGVLTHLPPQGVFLLNTALTVEKGSADSHTTIWYEFSEKVIKYVYSVVPDALWLLMGARALEFKNHFGEDREDRILVTSHPSPLSAYRGFRGYPAFLGSGIFRKINEILKPEIKW